MNTSNHSKVTREAGKKLEISTKRGAHLLEAPVDSLEFIARELRASRDRRETVRTVARRRRLLFLRARVCAPVQ